MYKTYWQRAKGLQDKESQRDAVVIYGSVWWKEFFKNIAFALNARLTFNNIE